MSNQTAISSSALRASLDLRVIVSRIRRRMMAVTDDTSLSPTQASVLRRVAKGDATTASALAVAEGVTPQSMATTLASLAAAGLVVRTPDPTDRRRQIVELTDTGLDRVAGAREAGREWMATAMEQLYTEDERTTILAALNLLERLGDA